MPRKPAPAPIVSASNDVTGCQISHAIVDARFREDFDAAGGTRSVLSYDGDKGFAELDGVAPGFPAADTHRDRR